MFMYLKIMPPKTSYTSVEQCATFQNPRTLQVSWVYKHACVSWNNMKTVRQYKVEGMHQYISVGRYARGWLASAYCQKT